MQELTLKTALAAVAVALLATQGQAATLTATSNSSDTSPFEITFDDNNGNELFDLGEETFFSGFVLTFFKFVDIVHVPNSSATVANSPNPDASEWTFFTLSTLGDGE